MGIRKRRKDSEPKQSNLKTFTIVTAVVLLFVAGIAAFFLNNNEELSRSEVDFELPLQPSLGSDDAPVKVVEFGDFKCPACKRFHELVFPDLVQDYIESGEAEFFFINFQFLAPDSVTAGIAGECIYLQDEAAFWEYYDAMYEYQGPESQQWATPERILELVDDHVSGVDAAALEQCIKAEVTLDQVEADRQIGRLAGVISTPSIFVNGVKLRNYGYDAVRTAIERELANRSG